ncbi:hypothetical protein D3C85_1621900 [compost metagenome]
MNFKFTSPIGRTLESILADAKKLLRPNSIAMQRQIRSATKYPDKTFTEKLGIGLPQNEDGQWSSPETTAKYKAEFERINHFRK